MWDGGDGEMGISLSGEKLGVCELLNFVFARGFPGAVMTKKKKKEEEQCFIFDIYN